MSLWDWLADGDIIVADSGLAAAADARFEAIADYHQNRVEALKTPLKGKTKLGAALYRPLPPDALYLSRDEWTAHIAAAAGTAARRWKPRRAAPESSPASKIAQSSTAAAQKSSTA